MSKTIRKNQCASKNIYCIIIVANAIILNMLQINNLVLNITMKNYKELIKDFKNSENKLLLLYAVVITSM